MCVFLSQQQPKHISSSVDLSSESVSSFTSASSLPLLRRDRLYVYESTLTLQRISSLLTDGENQSREEEDEDKDSRSPSSTDALPGCPEQTVTLGGSTDPIFFSNLKKDALVELVLSAEGEPCVGLYLHTIHIERQSKDKEKLKLFSRGRRRC